MFRTLQHKVLCHLMMKSMSKHGLCARVRMGLGHSFALLLSSPLYDFGIVKDLHWAFVCLLVRCCLKGPL